RRLNLISMAPVWILQIDWVLCITQQLDPPRQCLARMPVGSLLKPGMHLGAVRSRRPTLTPRLNAA
ncbi:MAG TPA: hypothetical protein VI756_10235, partial [Blastocatellia bacterium]